MKKVSKLCVTVFVHIARCVYIMCVHLAICVYVMCAYALPSIDLSPLALVARHVSGSAFCWVNLSFPEQALGFFPPIPGLGLVVARR